MKISIGGINIDVQGTIYDYFKYESHTGFYKLNKLKYSQ